MTTISYRAAQGGELVDGAALLADALGFAPRDAIPPWLMQTVAGVGGLALGAFCGERLIGFSFAVPCRDGSLFSCGLAVRPACRSRAVGRGLKIAQGQAARAAGCSLIRWTADPLNGPGLRLYLSRLGARLTAYRAGLYDSVRPGGAAPQDDVVIEWRLDRPAAPPTCAGRVELPCDIASLSAEEQLEWRLRVRQELGYALAAGAVGVGVERAAGRVWLLLGEA